VELDTCSQALVGGSGEGPGKVAPYGEGTAGETGDSAFWLAVECHGDGPWLTLLA